MSVCRHSGIKEGFFEEGCQNFHQMCIRDRDGTVHGNANKYALGYTYDLSKRTSLYAVVSYLDSDNGYVASLNNDMGTENTSITGVDVYKRQVSLLIARRRSGNGIPVLFSEWQNPLDETGPVAVVTGFVGGKIKCTEVARSNAPCQVGQTGRIAVIVFD